MVKQTDIQRKILDWLDTCPVEHEISSMAGSTMHIKVSTSQLSPTRKGPVEDEPMCTHCNSSDVKVNDDEEGDISQGYCNECEEDRELTICEYDRKTGRG